MVILYSNGCEKCVKLKEKLDNSPIKYIVFDDEKAMIEMGFSKVPLLFVDGEYLGYFDALQYVKTMKERLNEIQNDN